MRAVWRPKPSSCADVVTFVSSRCNLDEKSSADDLGETPSPISPSGSDAMDTRYPPSNSIVPIASPVEVPRFIADENQVAENDDVNSQSSEEWTAEVIANDPMHYALRCLLGENDSQSFFNSITKDQRAALAGASTAGPVAAESFGDFGFLSVMQIVADLHLPEVSASVDSAAWSLDCGIGLVVLMQGLGADFGWMGVGLFVLPLCCYWLRHPLLEPLFSSSMFAVWSGVLNSFCHDDNAGDVELLKLPLLKLLCDVELQLDDIAHGEFCYQEGVLLCLYVDSFTLMPWSCF
ncbi:hypothetical protein Nepgr_003961 [Nepenthes gracilis]|uniref:Uncharacterized protein n=1 Tax=Nepenthes gracilis TaxID=150966 RepID=A0AAD3S0P4_NEPGR|nr:hypothetical protein Nepgr_003961 [Nepenthes gracilis]